MFDAGQFHEEFMFFNLFLAEFEFNGNHFIGYLFLFFFIIRGSLTQNLANIFNWISIVYFFNLGNNFPKLYTAAGTNYDWIALFNELNGE